MKRSLLLCVLAANAMAAQPVLVRISPEALVKLQQMDPMSRLEKPAEGAAKVINPHHQSIIRQSTILHDGDHWTLVPNGAVIFQPAAHKDRVNAQAAGILLPWAEFVAKNSSWITTCEVTLDQAAGSDALPVDAAALWPHQNKIVVAVHRGGPISVRMPGPTHHRSPP